MFVARHNLGFLLMLRQNTIVVMVRNKIVSLSRTNMPFHCLWSSLFLFSFPIFFTFLFFKFSSPLLLFLYFFSHSLSTLTRPISLFPSFSSESKCPPPLPCALLFTFPHCQVCHSTGSHSEAPCCYLVHANILLLHTQEHPGNIWKQVFACWGWKLASCWTGRYSPGTPGPGKLGQESFLSQNPTQHGRVPMLGLETGGAGIEVWSCQGKLRLGSAV